MPHAGDLVTYSTGFDMCGSIPDVCFNLPRRALNVEAACKLGKLPTRLRANGRVANKLKSSSTRFITMFIL